MFSWSKKKDNKKRDRGGSAAEENEFGIKIDKGPSEKQLEAELKALAGIDSFPDDDINMNEGEEDEESELLRLIGRKPKKTINKESNPDKSSPVDIMTDITAETDLGEEDIEVDENDPDLLGELLELTQDDDCGFERNENGDDSDEESEEPKSGGEGDILSLLKERIKMYKTAESKAKENNESSRARRFTRGLKTLEDLLKKAKLGKTISPSDIPPVIALNLKPVPVPPEITQNQSDCNEPDNDPPCLGEFNESSMKIQGDSTADADIMLTLTERLKLYQLAETKAKEAGETIRARRFTRGMKALETLIEQVKQGGTVASSDIPPVVAMNLKPAPPIQQSYELGEEKEDEVTAIDLDNSDSNTPNETKNIEEVNVMHILSERLQMYEKAEERAKEVGDGTRARRFNRGIKTLQGLIKRKQNGDQIPPDEIPPPVALNLKAPVVTAKEEVTSEVHVENDNLVQSSDGGLSPIKFTALDDEEDIDIDDEILEEDIPTTVMEGLEQRLRIYNKLLEKAQNEGNNVMAQQNVKIIAIYKNAIRTFKCGGYIDVLKLPSPRGCPPIPIPFYAP